MENCNVTITDFPEELLTLLFEYLELKDIIHLSMVSKTLYKICQDDIVWKSTFRGPYRHLQMLSNGFKNGSRSETPEWKVLALLANTAYDCGQGGPLDIVPRSSSVRIRGRYSEMLFAKFGESQIDVENMNTQSSSTVEVWFKTRKGEPAGIILGNQSESVSRKIWPHYHWQLLHIGPDGHIRGSILTYCLLKGPFVADGRWHHVAITGNFRSQKLYVDGRLVDSSDKGFGSESHQKELRYCQLGTGYISYGYNTPYGEDAMPRGHCGQLPFKGKLRDFRIWRRERSQKEIDQQRFIPRIDLYLKEENPNSFNDLLYLWPLTLLQNPEHTPHQSRGSRKDFDLKTVDAAKPLNNLIGSAY